MSSENLPPFYKGQKVVALIEGTPIFRFKKGDILTVNAIYQHCCPGSWLVDVGELAPITDTRKCSDCGKLLHIVEGRPFYMSANIFAPAQENFQSITLEKVLEKETELISAN